VFHLRGEQYLPAKLRDWPIPTRSGEVVLVRREGDEVVFLNQLSQAPDAALRLRQALNSEHLLAAQLVRSGALTTVTLDGIDYKGVPAFGAGRTVPGSDWFLLAKTDHAEIYAAAVEEAGWIVLSTALAVLMALLFFRIARQRQALAESFRTQAVQGERLQALQLLSAVSNGSEDAIFAKDLDGRYTLFNEAASRVVGKPVSEVIGRDDLALFPPEQAAALRRSGQLAIASGRPLTEEHTLQTAQGLRIFLSTRGPLHDAAGSLIGEFGVSRDITEAKRTESSLRRANRMLLTSHGCSQVLMRAASVGELLQAVCETIVHIGGYRFAWVGMADPGDERLVRPVAQAGFEAGYLESARITWADEPDGHGPTGTAIRERRPVTVRNLIEDPSCVPGREAALQRGYAASIALPLLPGDGDCLGALNLCAAEADAFDEDEVRSAVELANDLAFGIRALRDREARLAEEARYRALFAANPQPMWVHELDSLAFLEVNDAAIERYGYRREEFLAMRVTDIEPPQALPAPSDLATQPGVVRHRLKDGRIIQASISSHRIAYLSRQAMLVLAVDVTAQLAAEAALKVIAEMAAVPA
jgi:PAS domain S-box-containing protein